MSSEPEQPTAHGPPLDRRTFLRAAGAGAGAVATGAGAQQVGLSPVGDAEAIACGGLCVGSLLAVGAAAGIAVKSHQVKGDTSIDSASILEDEVYNSAVAVAEGRSSFVDQMQSEYLDAPTGESPFADTAWSEIRAAAAKAIVNGKSDSDAQQAAQTALDRTATRAIYNMVDRWNTGVLALLDSFQTQASESLSVLEIGGDVVHAPIDASHGSWSLDDGAGSHGFLHSRAVDGPAPLADIDGIPDDAVEYGLAYSASSGSWAYVLGANTHAYGTSDTAAYGIDATHSDSALATITAMDSQLYQNIISRISSEYSNISGDLGTYVTNLSAALDQGAIDAADIYSPSDLVDQFASSDKRSRTAAELAAVGAGVPDSLSYEALISHPGLEVDQLWCDVYPQFSGSAIDIEPGITIGSSDYDMAFIGYTSAATDEYVTDTLSGGSDLQILDVAGVEGERDVTGSAPSAPESSGDINLGSDPPDEVANPGSYDDTFNVVVSTESGNTYTAPVADVTTNSDGEYIVPASSTGLSGSESLASVRIVPTVQTEQTSEFVADPSTVDSQQVQDLLQSQKDMVSKVEKLEDEANGGSGFLGGGGLLGGGGGLVGGVVLAGLGILTLGQLSG